MPDSRYQRGYNRGFHNGKFGFTRTPSNEPVDNVYEAGYDDGYRAGTREKDRVEQNPIEQNIQSIGGRQKNIKNRRGNWENPEVK
jgi:hypothetical protein